MLLNLINDLLDLAKKQKNTFELHQSYFSLKESVRSVFSTMEFLSRTRNIQTKLVV